MKTARLMMAGLALLTLSGAARADGWNERQQSLRFAFEQRVELAANDADSGEEARANRRDRREQQDARHGQRDERRDRIERATGDDNEHFGVGYERRRQILDERRRGR